MCQARAWVSGTKLTPPLPREPESGGADREHGEVDKTHTDGPSETVTYE